MSVGNLPELYLLNMMCFVAVKAPFREVKTVFIQNALILISSYEFINFRDTVIFLNKSRRKL